MSNPITREIILTNAIDYCVAIGERIDQIAREFLKKDTPEKKIAEQARVMAMIRMPEYLKQSFSDFSYEIKHTLSFNLAILSRDLRAIEGQEGKMAEDVDSIRMTLELFLEVRGS